MRPLVTLYRGMRCAFKPNPVRRRHPRAAARTLAARAARATRGRMRGDDRAASEGGAGGRERAAGGTGGGGERGSGGLAAQEKGVGWGEGGRRRVEKVYPRILAMPWGRGRGSTLITRVAALTPRSQEAAARWIYSPRPELHGRGRNTEPHTPAGEASQWS